MLRGFLYARISVEERNQKKYSIPAQISRMEEHCRINHIKICDTFIDDGISAATIKKRKELCRMLDSLDDADIVLFTQLDRFSRNVLDANRLLEQFEKHNVSFRAVDEDDIDTSTADGRFIFNLKVNLAERERIKTSERIKAVNEFKRKNKQVTFGVGPTGYEVKDHKWVTNEKAVMIYDLFDTYIKTGSRQATREMLESKYNYSCHPATVSHFLSQKCYTGEYKGIPNYYPVIISMEMWNEAQRLRNANTRNRSLGVVYIFRGLLRCKYCGHIMTGAYPLSKPGANRKAVYRCSRKSDGIGSKNYCTEIHQIREEVVEVYLLENVEKQIKEYMVQIEQEESKKQEKKIDVASIKNKLTKLKDLYLADMIQLSDYESEYKKLSDQLEEVNKSKIKKSAPDYKPFKAVLSGFLEKEYKDFTSEQKRYFWRSLIDYIEVDKQKNMTIHFKR
ncbi:recombinase family protein [Holdemania massiliensis]|uniref:recombinase family protein n=1 Tax=Holdemania massiliensis TaxID=1468449 RepID=UPI002432EAF8|nr:recombinase family protein [Holdemania massiliensis]